MTVQVEAGLVRLPFGDRQRGRLLQERHAQLVRAGRHRDPRLEMLVDLRMRLSALRRENGEQSYPLAIQQQLQLVRLVQTFDLFVAISTQPDSDLVLAG